MMSELNGFANFHAQSCSKLGTNGSARGWGGLVSSVSCLSVRPRGFCDFALKVSHCDIETRLAPIVLCARLLFSREPPS